MATHKGGGSSNGPDQNLEEDHMTNLLERLNLTREEEEYVAFSDDDEVLDEDSIEFALIDKVMSLTPLHISTIMSAMKLAWGNPFDLRLRSMGEKTENLFIAEFGSVVDKFRTLRGSPWMASKHAVVLQMHDEILKP
jgi:hypothetical protein